MSYRISGEKYAMMYGPTTGDKVRLADIFHRIFCNSYSYASSI